MGSSTCGEEPSGASEYIGIKTERVPSPSMKETTTSSEMPVSWTGGLGPAKVQVAAEVVMPATGFQGNKIVSIAAPTPDTGRVERPCGHEDTEDALPEIFGILFSGAPCTEQLTCTSNLHPCTADCTPEAKMTGFL